MRAHDTAGWGGSDWTRADLAEDWERHGLERESRVVELDGRVAGYVETERLSDRRLFADGYVDPAVRGCGVGSSLAGAVEALATGVIHYAALRGSEAFFRGRGYREIRHTWRMVIELSEAPEVAVPAGIDIRAYRPGEEQAIHAAVDDAWSVGGWLHEQRPFEEFRRRNFGRPAHDPSLYFVAVDGDEIAGIALCDPKRNGDWGWVDTLGVRPAWRRRGIAEALLRTAFGAFFERGERTVALHVDAQSPTGATRLYERAGMRVLYEVVLWEKILGDG